MTKPIPTHPKRREGEQFVCGTCRGPCRTYKGSVHKWTCEACLAERVADRARPA